MELLETIFASLILNRAGITAGNCLDSEHTPLCELSTAQKNYEHEFHGKGGVTP